MERDQRDKQGLGVFTRGRSVSKFSQEKQSRLLGLLGEELALFKQIRGLTEKQTELLTADDTEAFDESLERRQELIEKINGLHQETDLLMQSYISFSSSAGGGKIDAVETAAERIRGVIAECAALNDSNITMVKGMAEEYVKRIDKLSLSRKSLGAYAQNVPSNSMHFDRKT